MRFALRIAAAILLLAGAAFGAEVRAMTSDGFTASYNELRPAFEQATGHKVLSAYGASQGGAPDSIPSRLERGEAVDVVILARAGARKPDITTVDALKRTLLEAKSIAYSASASGVYLSTELFPRLGIVEQMKDKAKRIESERVGSVVARGDAEIGFQQVSELLPIAGVDFAGTLPPEVQKVTVFSAGVSATAQAPEAARALIRYLASPAVAPALIKAGLEPPAR